MGQHTRKVPGGKLLTVTIEQGRAIITGDFFLHPEEKLPLLEDALSTILVDAHDKGHSAISSDAVAPIRASLARIAQEENITMVGITPEAIAEWFVLASIDDASGNHAHGAAHAKEDF
ncbi:hypothetical protein AUJ68_01640 [Candidatus Woesearchaeota archaeon CG1_02_57_44]|nr:MAG: hypothetical protein AUJ68_01640 [Candidatus Woesearchaeota archaeon CG1_02_57_44]PIN68260.1 MAG: hypothetical protein COV94_05675 [Candidatus Woesearchaeota archaeon CG11_big_fil_rev_8_21_14_0_20_57_5]